MTKPLLFLFIITSYAFADMKIPSLTDMMSLEDQKKTGVIRLKQQERKELAIWLYEHGFSQNHSSSSKSSPLRVSININEGKKLQLTDDSIWEVDPSDLSISSSWLGDVEVKIYPSGDPTYPYLIVNTQTNRSVKAKKIQS